MDDALKRAESLQRAAAGEGFDWAVLTDLWPKLQEEIVELQQTVDQTAERRVDELGDLLFMVVNLARHLDVDPRQALLAANAKFSRRYGHVIAHADEFAPIGDPQRLQQMEARWVEAKQRGL